MPNIQSFDAPDLTIRPSETGVESVAAAARRGGAFYNSAGEAMNAVAASKEQTGRIAGNTIASVGQVAQAVDTYESHQEISHGAATFAQLQDNLTNQWNDMAKNADPNDPSVAAKFREQVLEPALDKFNGSFQTERGQQFAEQHVEALRQHMFQKSAADMSTLAGVAVKNNVQNSAVHMTNTAFNDPSSVPFLLESVDHNVGGIIDSSPNLKGADALRAKMDISQDTKRQIVKAGVQGAIKNSADPEKTAADWTAKYPNYIDGAEAQTVAKAAKVQAKSNLLTDKQMDLYNKQQADQRVHAAANKVMTDNVTIDPSTNQPVIKPNIFKDAIELARQNPNAPSAAATARTLIDWGQKQQTLENKASDPVARQDLTDRMFSTDNPTTEVQLMKAQVDGKLSKDDFASMHRLVTALNETPLKGPVWHDTLAAAKDALIVNVPGLSGKDNVGVQNYAKFVQEFIPQYLAASRAGTLPPNALDTKDPKSMISLAMAPYKRTVMQRMNDYTAGIAGLGAVIGGGPGEQPGGPKPPALHEVRDGYEYIGGSPGAASSWKKVQ